MDELLQQLSEQTGIPVDMLERSARARAGAGGTTAEAILAGWAGAPVPSAGETAAAPPPAAPPPEPAPAAAEAEAPAPSLEVEVLEPEPPAEEEPVAEPEPEPVAAGPGLPGWLSAAFVFIPFIAVLYALYIPNGPDCGSAGRLEIDPVRGNAVNCDGSEYGFEAPNFFAIGEEVYQSSACFACHGPAGGGGSGPALAGGAVVDTFSSCADHIDWVRLGTLGWQSERGDTYGDTGKPVGGVGIMPSFGSGATALDDEDLRAVVLYERVAFGNEDLASAETACFADAEAVAAP